MSYTTKGNITTQLIATLGALLLIGQTGLMDGWTTPNMARLIEGNGTLSLTLTEASWLVSCFHLGKFGSVVLEPMFLELAGSRRANLFIYMPISVSWILTMTAESATWLYIAKVFSGTADGLAYGCYSLFLGEVASSAHRGTFNSIALIGWPFGSLVATVAEAYLPSASCAIYLTLCLLGSLLFGWLPESPYWLVKEQRMDEAAESLAWYRGHNEVDLEMKEIIEFVESSGRSTLVQRIRQLRSPPIQKAVFLVVLAFMLPQVGGVFNVFFYMEILLINGKSHLVDPSHVAIYTNVVLLVSTIVTINLIDKLGRRVLMISSCAVMTMALVGLGLHYFLLNNLKVDAARIEALPVASIVALLVAFSIGVSPVMDAMLGEMFSAGVRTVAATVSVFTASFTAFVAAKTYQPLIDAIGETCVFWMYAAFMALAGVVFLLLMPETKGKSLQEIQNDLNKN